MTKQFRTPVIRPRTQGGTFYTFGSALEDIGLNINEGRNRVEMSHYVLLDIPIFDSGTGDYENLHLNTSGNYSNDDFINEGDMMFAESFQDYVLNMETVVRNQNDYNLASQKTVSERVFWKWIFKDRPIDEFFTYDENSGYYYEIQETSIAKAFGTISAGAQRTDDNGIYNETFVQIPSSYGQMRTFFKPVYDENYTIGSYKGTSQDTIEGFGDLTGVSTQHLCEFQCSLSLNIPQPGSTIVVSGTSVEFTVTSNKVVSGTIKLYAKTSSDISSIPSSGRLRLSDNSSIDYTNFSDLYSGDVLTTTGISIEPISDEIEDGYSIYNVSNDNNVLTNSFEAELDITKLRQIYKNPSISYDDIGMGKLSDGENYSDFTFNAILVYYSIYNSDKSRRLATNAYGVYILDNSIKSEDSDAFFFPSLNKIKATNVKQGSSYSFRINIKPTTAYSGDIHVEDNSTSAFSMSEDFNDIIRNLSSAITTLKNNTTLLYKIKKDDSDIKTMTENVMEKISEIEKNVNGIINGNFPYTAAGLYKKNPYSNVSGTLSPEIAKALIDNMTINYTEDGDMSVSINTDGLTGDTLSIAKNIQKTMNNEVYYNMLSILLVLVARTKSSSTRL